MSQSQNKAIVEHFKRGNTLTSLEAWKMFGCSALHSRIADIRNKMDVTVFDEWVTVIGFEGVEKRVKKYYTQEYLNKQSKAA